MQLLDKAAAYMAPVGRIIMGAFFVLAALNKLMNVEGTAMAIESIGFPAGTLFAILTIILLLGAGGALLIGLYPKPAALALAAFVLFVSFPYHGPQLWADDPMQQIMFMKNMVIFGSLLFMAAHAGAFADYNQKDDTPVPTL